MVKVTLKDGSVVEGTSEEIQALDLFVETDVVESEEVDVETFEVGDYARVVVTDTSFNSTYRIGDIVKISKIDGSDVPYRAGVNGNNERWFSLEHLSEVSAEEIAEAKVQTEVNEVFTANGRKVNEYREGDIVEFTDDYTAIGVVEDIGSGREETDLLGVRSSRLESSYQAPKIRDVKPVVFVENRLDRK